MAKKEKEAEAAPSDEALEQASEFVKKYAPLQPYDRVRLTFEDGSIENCFYVSEGIYSKANSAGNAFKVGSERTGVVKVEKI